MRGALSLEYIAKLIIMLIVVLVVIVFILKYVGVIRFPTFGEEERCKTEFVNINFAEKNRVLGKIEGLVDLCFSRFDKTEIKDCTCFIARRRGGFSLTSNEIYGFLPNNLKKVVTFDTQNFNSENIVIIYLAIDRKILLRD